MKGLYLLLTLLLLGSSTFAQEEDPGHAHGPDGRHIVAPAEGKSGASPFILSHHDMRVEGADGKSVLGVKVNSSIYRKGQTTKPIHTELNVYEPENEVYGSHMSYEQAGEYVLSQDVEMPGGKRLKVEFPVYVTAGANGGTASEEEHHHVNWFLWIGGGVALLGLIFAAFKFGQKSSGATAAGTLTLLLIAGTLMPVRTFAQEEDDDHTHGPDGKHVVTQTSQKSPELPLFKAFAAPDNGKSATQTVDGIKFVLTIENEEVTPDINLVSVSTPNIGLIGLKTAVVEVSSTAGGLQTTGRVSANPNGLVKVNARSGGRVVRLGALPGTTVRSGQMLAQIESSELAEAQAAYVRDTAEVTQGQAGIRIAEAGLSSATTELKIAERTLARQRQLAQTGAFESPSLEAAKAKLSEAKSSAETRQSEVSTLESLLARQRQGLEAGVVAKRDVERTVSELSQAKSELADAKSQLQLAENALVREEAIARRGLRNAKEIETAAATVEMSRAAVKSAQSRLLQARSDVSRIQAGIRIAGDQIRILGGVPGGGNIITLTSPMAAEVEHRMVSVGQTVATGELLYDLLNADVVWVLVDVYERDLKRIRVGQSIEVVADAHPNHTYEGVVAFIHNEVDPATRTTTVRVVINNPGERLKQNMFVRVILATGTEALTLVPSASLQKDGGLDVVFTEEKVGTYRKNIVQVQGTIGNRTILKGLKQGQKVVTDGSYQLLSMGAGK